MATATHPATTAPDRSLTQRLDALERANEVRTKRAKLKRDLKGGRVPIHALLLDPPDFAETMRVRDALLAVPQVGHVKVSKILTQCRVSPSRSLGVLTDRQRGEIVSLLRHLPLTADGVYELLRDDFPAGATLGQLRARLSGRSIEYRLAVLRKTGAVRHDREQGIWIAV